MNQILNDVFYFCRHNLLSILKLVLPLVSLLVLINYALHLINLELGVIYGLSMLFELVVHPFYMAIIINYVGNKAEGTNSSLSINANLWSRLVLLNFVYSAFVFSGLLLLLIPGIMIAIRLSLAEIYLLRHRLDIKQALAASWEGTGLHFFTLFKGSLVIALVFLLFGLPLTLLGEVEGLLALAVMFVSAIISTAGLIAITVFYYRVFTLEQQRLEQEEPVNSASDTNAK